MLGVCVREVAVAARVPANGPVRHKPSQIQMNNTVSKLNEGIGLCISSAHCRMFGRVGAAL